MERRDRQPPTLAEVVATLMTFRRLLVVWGIVPLVLAAAPLVISLYLVIMNFLTSGSGFLSSVLTVVITLIGRHAITFYAPSAKQRDESLSDSRILLPLIGFVCSRIIISGVLSPITTLLGFQGVIMFLPRLPYISSLLIAACMLLLGAAVLFRFVGPVSVGKDSYRLSSSLVVARTVLLLTRSSPLAREVLISASAIRPSLGVVTILLGTMYFIWMFSGARHISEPSLRRRTYQMARDRVSLSVAITTSYGRASSFLLCNRIHTTSLSTNGTLFFIF